MASCFSSCFKGSSKPDLWPDASGHNSKEGQGHTEKHVTECMKFDIKSAAEKHCNAADADNNFTGGSNIVSSTTNSTAAPLTWADPPQQQQATDAFAFRVRSTWL